MTSLDQRTSDLRDLVEQILHQFRLLASNATNGPHADLSLQEVRVVEHLGDKGPRIMRELAEHLLLAVNSVTSTVDNLERKGMVRRLRSDEDRRVVRVELTDAGEQVYRSAINEKSALLAGMLFALTEEEQQIFMVLFRKIARAGWTEVRKLGPNAE